MKRHFKNYQFILLVHFQFFFLGSIPNKELGLGIVGVAVQDITLIANYLYQ